VLNRLKLNYLFRAGYEFKKVFVNKVSINYGVDLHHSLHDVESQYILGLAQNPLPYPEKERLSGLLGFMGVKYHINENISVSLEGNFSVLHKVFYEVVYSGGGLIYINNKPIGNGTVLVDRTPYKSFDIKLQPIELINLSYHF
jgi:hypothetical protein